jgi:hypothetical protein
MLAVSPAAQWGRRENSALGHGTIAVTEPYGRIGDDLV